jgi:hypothetical protein
MNRWEDRLYLLPDDQCATLGRLYDMVPVEHAISLAEQIEGFLLVGLTEGDEVVLHMVVHGIEARMWGSPLVPFDQRQAVEEVLPMLGQSTTEWLEVYCISGDPDALQGFKLLWEKHVLPGLPAASSAP